MVLGELGAKINQALQEAYNRPLVGQDVDDMLKQICNGLLAADVQFRLVVQMRQRMQDKIKQEFMVPGVNKRKILRQVVLDELTALVDPRLATKPFQPVKAQANVIMLVGLQGAGKTTTLAKLAYHYKRRGWKTGLICADAFRAGAYYQLRQLAVRIKVPFYGDRMETDPVQVAKKGVDLFKQEGYEIIFVDTSGRHMQETALFEEMQQLSESVVPDTIMYVLDGSIGQMAYDQVVAFKERVTIGSIIITKLDGHAKGGGALSAVAATSCPITFIGTGEHMDDLDPFDAKRFVGKMLGMGDLVGLDEVMKNAVANPSGDPQHKCGLTDRLFTKKFTLRDLYQQFASIMQMGPLNKVLEMLPGMSDLIKFDDDGGQGASRKIKIYLTIMDSMTDEELDLPQVFAKNAQSRIIRIARGSGRPVTDVNNLLSQYRVFCKKGAYHPPGLRGVPAKGQPNLAQISNMIPPGMMKQLGGMTGLQDMMRSLGGRKGG